MIHRTKLVIGWTMLFAVLLTTAYARQEETSWRIAGDLSESCSCSVPCTCNFGAGASPHSFCWFIFSLDIQEGNYGTTSLEGLRMAGAGAAKGVVMYIDERANQEQADALKKIANTIVKKLHAAYGFKSAKDAPKEMRLLGFKRAKIEQVVGEKSHKLKIGDAGYFESDYIMGIDGKTPVVVENNWSWNIQHGIKAKAKTFRYKDGYGNQFSFKDNNANQGKFDWSDTTPIYFR